jgi:hypothetical protein
MYLHARAFNAYLSQHASHTHLGVLDPKLNVAFESILAHLMPMTPAITWKRAILAPYDNTSLRRSPEPNVPMTHILPGEILKINRCVSVPHGRR